MPARQLGGQNPVSGVTTTRESGDDELLADGSDVGVSALSERLRGFPNLEGNEAFFGV